MPWLLLFQQQRGPTIAAIILSVASWKWLFAINVPIGIAALVLAMKYLPQNEAKHTHRFDGISAILNAFTFAIVFHCIYQLFT